MNHLAAKCDGMKRITPRENTPAFKIIRPKRPGFISALSTPTTRLNLPGYRLPLTVD